jgi:hypothetical protein
MCGHCVIGVHKCDVKYSSPFLKTVAIQKFLFHTFSGTYVIPMSELYLVERCSCTCTTFTIINSLCTNCLTSGHSERPLSYLTSLSRSGLANFNALESNVICKDLFKALTFVHISKWGIELSKTPFLQTVFFSYYLILNSNNIFSVLIKLPYYVL